jgi:hypothetical protein
MRTAILAIATLLQASTAQAERFAVACSGTAHAEQNLAGPAVQSRDVLPQQIYIIDEQKSTVQRALLPRQQFENLCPSETVASVDISPGLIRVTSAPDVSENAVDCSFELDRQTGKGLFKLDMSFPGNRYNRLRWDMTCEKTAIPVFDLTKNRF